MDNKRTSKGNGIQNVSPAEQVFALWNTLKNYP